MVRFIHVSVVLLIIATMSTAAAWGQQKRAKRPAKPTPTLSDVKYGPHKRNVLDFWKAKSQAPTPLVVYINGGGFREDSKNSINAGTLKELLASGISVAAIQHRLLSDAKLPAAHHDSRRALQFLRSKAGEWNLDKTRVGAFGGSAGAQICMWLAFHDEMADPKSDDPLERESSRLTCVATRAGQTAMWFAWRKKWIPGYAKSHRPIGSELIGEKTPEERQKLLTDLSALDLISKDDPPIRMFYGMAPGDPAPDNPVHARGWRIHHVMFGVKLKEKMDELGVESDLKYPGAKSKYGSLAKFFKAKLLQ